MGQLVIDLGIEAIESELRVEVQAISVGFQGSDNLSVSVEAQR